MKADRPSRTAWAAAAHRAAHQVLEQGLILNDPLALRILGSEAASAVTEETDDPSRRRMRIFIAARSRFAEDALRTAVERGVRQLVVLGAGLDTLAYRTGLSGRIRMFEVDHPATQDWKQELLRNADIAIPASLTYCPIDFEQEPLLAGLTAAGFDATVPTFFIWLGVVPYLTEEAVYSTLSFIAGIPQAQVVFDYSNPPDQLSPEARASYERRAAQVERQNEAWITHFDSATLRTELLSLGFSDIEDLSPKAIAARYFPGRPSTAGDQGGHICRAAQHTAS